MEEIHFDKVILMIKEAKYAIVFSGAGISTESGVPDFRGPGGLWEIYNPSVFSIDYFKNNPRKSWEILGEIQVKSFSNVQPNKAHKVIAEMEKLGLIKAIITQNIDNLHQNAGSKNVIEFHGNSQYLVCLKCKKKIPIEKADIPKKIPPKCDNCGGLLKPDFVFFGEQIPMGAHHQAIELAKKADLVLIVGSSGAVLPAADIPFIAKQKGAKIIEINLTPTEFTDKITDIFISGKAGAAFEKIAHHLNLKI